MNCLQHHRTQEEVEIMCEAKLKQDINMSQITPSSTIPQLIQQAKDQETQYIVSRYLKCYELNQLIQHWFAKHAREVVLYFQEQSVQVTVELMGSRRWQLMHYASDIDAAIVTEADPGKARKLLSEFYSNHLLYHTIKQQCVTTKAGLELLVMSDFGDTEIGQIKLEYTIQTPLINQLIIAETEKLLQANFSTVETKAQYSHTMATLVSLGMHKQTLKLGTADPILQLKSVLKVLPEDK